MRLYRRGTAVAFALSLAVLSSGCQAPQSQESDLPSVITHEMSAYPNMLSAEDAFAQSVIVVEGTVSDIGPSSWSTRDRRKPSDEPGADRSPTIIYTPFRVQIDRTYKGEPPSYIDVKAFGGTVGEDTFIFSDGEYLPHKGERVVVFVQQMFTERNGDELAVPRSLYTVDGNTLVNRFGGDSKTLSEAEFEQAVNRE